MKVKGEVKVKVKVNGGKSKTIQLRNYYSESYASDGRVYMYMYMMKQMSMSTGPCHKTHVHLHAHAHTCMYKFPVLHCIEHMYMYHKSFRIEFERG